MKHKSWSDHSRGCQDSVLGKRRNAKPDKLKTRTIKLDDGVAEVPERDISRKKQFKISKVGVVTTACIIVPRRLLDLQDTLTLIDFPKD